MAIGSLSVHFLRSIGTSVAVPPDVNRRTWNGTFLALRGVRVYFWCMVVSVMMNLDHGPWATANFWEKLKAAAKQHSTVAARAGCPLVDSEMTNIMQELQLARDVDVGDEDFVDQESSAFAVKNSIPGVVEKKYGKIGMCRWFQFIVVLHRLLSEWSRRWVVLSYMFVMLGGKAVQHAALVQAAASQAFKDHDDADPTKANMKQDRAELSKVRKMCNNTCEFVHTQLANRTLFKKMVLVSQVCTHAERFEHMHAITNVSAQASAKWWSERAADLGIGHVEDILSEIETGTGPCFNQNPTSGRGVSNFPLPLPPLSDQDS